MFTCQTIICVDGGDITSGMTTMGERLRKARIEAGYRSARQAAMAHNWHVSTYNAHENGQNEFDTEAAKTYAKAFKTTANWLLLGTVVPDVSSSPGIDNQIMMLDPEESRAIIERFNAILEGVRLTKNRK